MKLLTCLFLLISTTTFARESRCTRELQIKTLEAHLTQEFNEAYTYDKSKNSFISLSMENELTLNIDRGYLLAEGYVGECSGGSVWGRVGIKTGRKVLENGLCEIKDTVSSGMCED